MFALLRANLWATGLGILSAILLCICVAQSVKISGFLWIDGLEDKLSDCETDKNELRGERDQLIAAAKEAERLNKEQVQRIVTDQEKANAEAKNRYERDLARVRAGGVRQDLAHPRNPANPKAGSVPEAACRDDEENVCVSRSLVVQAAEIELKANSLIDLINDYLEIER